MEGVERLSVRLSNIQAAEPILAALRSIALGNRLLSINKARLVAEYCQELEEILTLIVTSVAPQDSLRRSASVPRTVSPLSGEALSALDTPPQETGRCILLVIGSERGLCGAFNDIVTAHAQHWLTQRSAAGEQVTLVSLGRQTEKALRRHGRLPLWSGRLSGTALPPLEVASGLTAEWLAAYEKGEVRAVYVVHNTPRGVAGYLPVTTQLLPLALLAKEDKETGWPPIIETEPAALLNRLAHLWLSVALFGVLLDSATAEHSARYQLLEGAVQNAERMISDLKMSLQMARQEAITTEVQDLASGAGLLR